MKTYRFLLRGPDGMSFGESQVLKARNDNEAARLTEQQVIDRTVGWGLVEMTLDANLRIRMRLVAQKDWGIGKPVMRR